MSEHTCGGRGPIPCPACGDLAAQERYARQWREQHPRGTWGDIWVCPLCTKAIQDITQNATYHPYDIERHQEQHGDSWRAYERLAAPGGADNS